MRQIKYLWPCIIISFLLSYPSLNFADEHTKISWQHWGTHDSLSKKTIDHTGWQTFLKKYVKTNNKGINTLDYQNIRENDRILLNDYIWRLSQLNISTYNQREQLAYWINLYNALVIKTVIDHYPIASINDINISPRFFAAGPWRIHLIHIENTPISLHDIQNHILRPIWHDPRIYYALNSASIGSPNLLKTAFTAKNTEKLLNKAAKDFINSLRGVHIINGKLVTSEIYQWHIDDFGGTDEQVIKHIKSFAKPPLQKQLQGINHITKTVFNWHLNDKPTYTLTSVIDKKVYWS